MKCAELSASHGFIQCLCFHEGDAERRVGVGKESELETIFIVAVNRLKLLIPRSIVRGDKVRLLRPFQREHEV